MSIEWGTTDYQDEERRIRLWRAEHPVIIRATWAVVAALGIGSWWLVIRFAVWCWLGY